MLICDISGQYNRLFNFQWCILPVILHLMLGEDALLKNNHYSELYLKLYC